VLLLLFRKLLFIGCMYKACTVSIIQPALPVTVRIWERG